MSCTKVKLSFIHLFILTCVCVCVHVCGSHGTSSAITPQVASLAQGRPCTLDWMTSKPQGCSHLHLPPRASPPTHLLCFPDSGNETEVFASPIELHCPLFPMSCGLSMVPVFWLSVHCPCDLLAKAQSINYHTVFTSSPNSCLSSVPSTNSKTFPDLWLEQYATCPYISATSKPIHDSTWPNTLVIFPNYSMI